jgi:hypothetical protein
MSGRYPEWVSVGLREVTELLEGLTIEIVDEYSRIVSDYHVNNKMLSTI